MAARFPCRCGKKLRVGDDLIGMEIVCPSCGETVEVPSQEELEQLSVAPDAPIDEMPVPKDTIKPGMRPRKGKPVDLAQAKRESRRALGRDRRKEADIRPGGTRLGAEARKEAREGLREQKRRQRESRKGAIKPGRQRLSGGARSEARAGLREQDQRRRESARQVRGVPTPSLGGGGGGGGGRGGGRVAGPRPRFRPRLRPRDRRLRSARCARPRRSPAR